uniref:Uncharacterized protein n=1 Tax=Romanomermis culicivorax TaxID=13658 RepID=A0A915L097_ROMCU
MGALFQRRKTKKRTTKSPPCLWSKNLRHILQRTVAASSAPTSSVALSNVLIKTPYENFDLQFCRRGLSCCGRDLERKLYEESQTDFRKLMQEKIIGLSHTFESRASKFDN